MFDSDPDPDLVDKLNALDEEQLQLIIVGIHMIEARNMQRGEWQDFAVTYWN